VAGGQAHSQVGTLTARFENQIDRIAGGNYWESAAAGTVLFKQARTSREVQS
jgi:hypothetical protein